jgi:cysteinyl-tRNA synthetase
MKLYNTATRSKNELKPIRKNEVGIYSCGPTVYSSPHIGNMYAYVCWDVLVKSLIYLGYEVKQVVNITDVGHLTDDADSGEDKMEKGSKKEGLDIRELAKKYENEFLENLELLNISKAWKMPKATETINDQIELIKAIEKNGFSYKTSDGVYFDISKFKDYGKFANLNLDKLREGIRVEKNEEKKNISDFALWKFSPKDKKRQMEWDSPWGVGFPGWHVECTAMSTKLLGKKFDIHTGGEDHIAVHHSNEIAQAYGAFGENTAKIWIHNAFMTFKGDKVSKSSGGLYTVFDLVEMGYDSLAFRYMVLGSHYRRGIEFSLDSLKVAEIALNKLRSLVLGWGDEGKVDENYKKEFIELINDDLAMPRVLALVQELIKDGSIENEDKKATLLDFDKVLGLNLGIDSRKKENVPEEIEKLVKEREIARENKDWQESDRLRELIKNKGYMVEDLEKNSKIIKIK